MTRIDVLERIAPPTTHAPEWDDVLGRAGIARRPRRAWLRLAPVAAVVGVALALLLAWPFHVHGSVLDEALAALGDGSVTHVVVADHLDAVVVDPRTGRIRSVGGREEIWYSPKRGVRVTTTFGGRAAGDTLRFTPPTSNAFLANDEVGLFVRDYGKSLRSGGFRVTGEGTVAGERVYWLSRRVKTVLASGQRLLRLVRTQQVAVSRRTFKPVFVRELSYGRLVADSQARVLSIETTSSMPRSGGVLPYGLTSSGYAPPSTIAQATRRMRKTPIVPRGAVAGLARTWIGEPTYYVAPFHGRVMGDLEPLPGVELYYGPLDGTGAPLRTGAYVSITEFPRENAEVRLEGIGRFRTDGDAVLEGARATLRLRGRFVIVQASDSKRALAAVRALIEQP